MCRCVLCVVFFVLGDCVWYVVRGLGFVIVLLD